MTSDEILGFVGYFNNMSIMGHARFLSSRSILSDLKKESCSNINVLKKGISSYE